MAVRRLALATLATLGVLALASLASASGIHLHPDPTISVTVPPFALVLPNSPTWSFTLTSSDTTPDDGILFSATEAPGTYYLRVFTNHDVVVKLEDGALSSGNVTFNPTYSWGPASGGGQLLINEYAAPGPADLYRSNGPAVATIDLAAFKVNVPSSDIVHFTPGSLSSTLTITIQDAQ